MCDRLSLRGALTSSVVVATGWLISGCVQTHAHDVFRGPTEQLANVEYGVEYDREQYVDRSWSVIAAFVNDTPLATEAGASLLGWVPGWSKYALKKGDSILSWDPRTGNVATVARLHELDTVSGWHRKETYSAAISADGSTMVISYGPELGPYYIFDLYGKSLKSALNPDAVQRMTGAGSGGSTRSSGMVLNNDGTQLALTLPSPDDVPDEHDGSIDAETYVIDLRSLKATRIARGVYPVGFLDQGELVCMREDIKRGRLDQDVLLYDMSGTVLGRISGVIDASTDGKRILTVSKQAGVDGYGARVTVWTRDLTLRVHEYSVLSQIKTKQIMDVALATPRGP